MILKQKVWLFNSDVYKLLDILKTYSCKTISDQGNIHIRPLILFSTGIRAKKIDFLQVDSLLQQFQSKLLYLADYSPICNHIITFSGTSKKKSEDNKNCFALIRNHPTVIMKIIIVPFLMVAARLFE